MIFCRYELQSFCRHWKEIFNIYLATIFHFYFHGLTWIFYKCFDQNYFSPQEIRWSAEAIVGQDNIVEINIKIVSLGSVVVFPDVQVVYVGKNKNWTVLVWKCFSLISDFPWKSGVYRFTRRRGEYRYFLWQIRRRIFLSYLTYFDAESKDYCPKLIPITRSLLETLWFIFWLFHLDAVVIIKVKIWWWLVGLGRTYFFLFILFSLLRVYFDVIKYFPVLSK